MEFLFNSTAAFENDLQQLSIEVRQQLTQRVNEIAHLFADDRKAFFQQARKPARVPLSNGFDSSLYQVRVNDELRLIFTIDEDPVFEQIIVTLFRAVGRSCAKEAFLDSANVLYPSLTTGKIEVGVIGG